MAGGILDLRDADCGAARPTADAGNRAVSTAVGRIGVAKPAAAPAGASLPSPVPVTVAVRAPGDDNDDDASELPSTPGIRPPRTACRRDRFVAGSVRGTFHPDLYMSSQDCIIYKGKRIGRSKFEKLGNSSMAKWHRSIRVIRDDGELEPLGEWLTRHGLPVIKGKQRISRKRITRVPPLQLPRAAAVAAAAAAAAAGYSGYGSGGNGVAAATAQDSSADEESSSGTCRAGGDAGSSSSAAAALGFGAAAEQLHKALTVAAQLAVAAAVVAPVAAGALGFEAVKSEESPAAVAAAWGSPHGASASDVDVSGGGGGVLGSAPSDCIPAEAAAAAAAATITMAATAKPYIRGEATAAAATSAGCDPPTGGAGQPTAASSFATAAAQRHPFSNAAAAATASSSLPSLPPASHPTIPGIQTIPPIPLPAAPAATMPIAGNPAHATAAAAFGIHHPTRGTSHPQLAFTSGNHLANDAAAAAAAAAASSATDFLFHPTTESQGATAATAATTAVVVGDGNGVSSALAASIDYDMEAGGSYCVPKPQLQPQPPRQALEAHLQWAGSAGCAAVDAGRLDSAAGVGGGNSSGLMPPGGSGVGDLVAGGSPVLMDSWNDLWNDEADDDDGDHAVNAVMWGLLSNQGPGADPEGLTQGAQLAGAGDGGDGAAHAGDGDGSGGTAVAAAMDHSWGASGPPSSYGWFGGGGGGACSSDPSGAAAAATPVLPATPGTGCSTAACGDRTAAVDTVAVGAAGMASCLPGGAATPATVAAAALTGLLAGHPSFISAPGAPGTMQRSSCVASPFVNQHLLNRGGFGAGATDSPPLCETPGMASAPSHCSASYAGTVNSAAAAVPPRPQPWAHSDNLTGPSRPPSAIAVVQRPLGGMLGAAVAGQLPVKASDSGKIEGGGGCGSTLPAVRRSRPLYPLAVDPSCTSGSSTCLPVLHDTAVAAAVVGSTAGQHHLQHQQQQSPHQAKPPPSSPSTAWMQLPPPLLPPQPLQSSSHPCDAAATAGMAATILKEDPSVLSDVCVGLIKSHGSVPAGPQISGGRSPGTLAAAAEAAAEAAVVTAVAPPPPPACAGFPHAAVGPVRRPHYRGYPPYYYPGYYPPYPPYAAACCHLHPQYSPYSRPRMFGATIGPSGGGGWPLMPGMPPGMSPPLPPQPQQLCRGTPRTTPRRCVMPDNFSAVGCDSAAASIAPGREARHPDAGGGGGSSSSGGNYSTAPVMWAKSPSHPTRFAGPTRTAEPYPAPYMGSLTMTGHSASAEPQQQPQQLSPYPYDWSYGAPEPIQPPPPHHQYHHPYHVPEDEIWMLQPPPPQLMPQGLRMSAPGTAACVAAPGGSAATGPGRGDGGGGADAGTNTTVAFAGSGSGETLTEPVNGGCIGGGVLGPTDPGVFTDGMMDTWYAQW